MNDLLVNMIFSSFVVECQTNLDLTVLEDDCRKLKINTPKRTLSNYGGWQSDIIRKKNINSNSEFERLHDIVKDKSEILLEEFGIKNQNLDIQFWANLNEKGDFNKIHSHPKSLLSGVFYVKVPDNSGNLIFTNPNPMVDLYFLDHIEKNNTINSGVWEIKPKENLLLFFSSWLQHQVMPNESNETRISIAFNVSGENK